MAESLRILLLANWGLGQIVLKALVSHQHCSLIGVVTRVGHDPVDYWASVVGSEARSLELRVWETSKGFTISKLAGLIADELPDAVISVSFHSIIPSRILNQARLGGFNLHPSLLPRYRGPSPLQWAILNGDKETGLTYHRMTDEVDAGAILLQQRIPIDNEAIPADIIERMKQSAGLFTNELVNLLLAGETDGYPQDESLASMAPRLNSEEANIDWTLPAPEVVNRIRAFDDPYAGAIAELEGKRVRCRRARLIEPKKVCAIPGAVLEHRGPYEVVVQTGNGTIEVLAMDEPNLEKGGSQNAE